jgi:hypothetical protein
MVEQGSTMRIRRRKISTRETLWGFGLVAALVFAAFPVSALATGGDRIPGSRFVSARGAALGDAYIGLADGVGESLFYNPAGLARIRGPLFEPINAQLGGNDKFVEHSGTDIYKFNSLSGYKANLEKNPGTNPGAGFALLPALGFSGFGVGALYQERLMAETNGTTIRYRSVYQFVPAAGMGLRLASGVLRVGYSIQWVNQASGDVTVNNTSSNLSYKDGLGQGQGYSHTLGMALTLPYQHTPTINVVARNVGGVSYSGKPIFVSATNVNGTPTSEKMSVDGSLGYLTKLTAGWSLDTQLSYRDATNSSSTRQIEHVAIGLEFTAMDRLFLRAGYGSGYPTAGLGVRSSRAEVNFAWYSEDLGNGTTSVRDLRYLFQFSLRAF